MDKIVLNKEELEHIKKHIIGYGNEGNIYKMNNHYLYKVYTIPLKCGDTPIIDKPGKYRLADDNTKIIDSVKELNGCFNNINSYPYYLDSNGVKKIYDETVIYEAIKRQEKISNTALPIMPLYIANKFRGCILKYHKGYFNIGYLKYFTKNKQQQILKLLLNKIKELTDNYVYDIDLDNLDNILIHPLTLNTEIIDLDGKSTVYSASFNDNLYKQVYYAFSKLVLNLVYNFDLEKYCEEDIDSIVNYFEHNNITPEIIQMILDGNIDSYDKNKQFLTLKK